MKQIFLLAVIAAFLGINVSADASQSMAAPKCSVKGVFLEENKREEAGRGISKGETFVYYDIKVKISKSAYVSEEEKNQFLASHGEDGCKIDKEYAVFQKRDHNSFNLKDMVFGSAENFKGKCISAETNFSGDGNFRSGNWIYNIEIIDKEDCNK